MMSHLEAVGGLGFSSHQSDQTHLVEALQSIVCP